MILKIEEAPTVKEVGSTVGESALASGNGVAAIGTSVLTQTIVGEAGQPQMWIRSSHGSCPT